MNNTGDGLYVWIGFFAIIWAAVWISDWSPLGTQYSTYEIYCAAPNANGECSAKDKVLGTKTTYRPNKDLQSVVYWTEDYAPSKYDNCAIVDAENWSCANGNQTHHMSSGKLDGLVFGAGSPQLIKKWEWWLLRITK